MYSGKYSSQNEWKTFIWRKYNGKIWYTHYLKHFAILKKVYIWEYLQTQNKEKILLIIYQMLSCCSF